MTGHAADDAPESALPAGSAPPEHEPEVEYRLGAQFRRPARTHFVLMAMLTAACAASRLPVLDGVAVVTGTLAFFFGVSYVWRGRFRTRVTGRGIEIRGYFNHFVPWDDVRDIEVTEFGPDRMAINESFGSPRYTRMRLTGTSVSYLRTSGGMARLASIFVVRADGTKLMLRAPLVSGWAADPDFDRKAWQLDQLCIQHARGAIA